MHNYNFKEGDTVYCGYERFTYLGKRGGTAVLRKEGSTLDYGRPLIDLRPEQ